MFVNISNHPLEKWGAEQLAEANRLGGGMVHSIQFPNVPPTATSEDVTELAKGVVATLANENPGTAMVQGEASLCFELSRMLLVLGWTATFQFVQFRQLRS